MKFLGIFGLVGTLCTFAIIAIMWGKQAETLTPHLNNMPKNNRTGQTTRSDANPRPIHAGAEMELRANLGMALIAYKMQTGDLPHSSTLTQPARTSNDILRLFLRQAGLPEKSFFFNGSFASTVRPDNITSGNNALAPGENHWAFVEGPKKFSTYNNVPVLIEPYRQGETAYRESDYGSGRGVLILLSDGSVKTATINAKGEPILNGKNILSADYYGWKGDTPKVFQPAFQ